LPVPLKGLNRLLRFMRDGRGARVCCEQAASSGGDGKQVDAVGGSANCEHPPGRHYDRPARSSLTDDPDIMPGDEKRSRRRQDTATARHEALRSRKVART
jgi:hypothetical protein